MSKSTADVKVFRVGQPVRWSSSSGGHTTVKEGEVVGVVRAGQTPREAMDDLDIWNRHAVKFDGRDIYTRTEASYLVSVFQPSRKAKPWLYWPRTMWLEAVDG